MAAIPLQGVAASSMLFCAMESHHPHEMQAVLKHAAAHPATARHDHSTHGYQKALTESASSSSLPDASHVCGVCGACCHGSAIAELPRWTAPLPLEQTRESEPFVLIHSPPFGVPDKPPRA